MSVTLSRDVGLQFGDECTEAGPNLFRCRTSRAVSKIDSCELSFVKI